MKRIALAAATAFGLTVAFTPVAAAETFSECRDRIEDTCALFVPRGSANWAACVETFIELECQGLPGSLTITVEELQAKLNAVPA